MYMTTIPLNGEAFCMPEQIMFVSSAKAVRKAIIANVGAAARLSQSKPLTAVM
jgi:hypothetical protein